ncbi:MULTISPECIES: PilZ domain-containing protein [Neisseria]|uniref:Type IV pilus biogenesis protein PilZ n=1 Tax=Neisseria wadsworthii 9715 TaxID=1030841 RepID=G4CTS7_9NEIS|nr:MULTISPECIES: PilZ domain-containing protein [Neisseria]EGZ43940.1 type IV pilus biogenesis protein PilZ [Neisseria wadsworthii 9715]KPN71859.1 pilus assembly protein [Neisseria sp. 83E34]
MNLTNLPGKMMSVQLKDKAVLYSSYMPFLEFGGVFVPSEDTFKLGDEVLLAIELGEDGDKKFLRTKVAWINPSRTSANRPKGIGLAFDSDEISIAVRNKIENMLGNVLRSERPTYTL